MNEQNNPNNPNNPNTSEQNPAPKQTIFIYCNRKSNRENLKDILDLQNTRTIEYDNFTFNTYTISHFQFDKIFVVNEQFLKNHDKYFERMTFLRSKLKEQGRIFYFEF